MWYSHCLLPRIFWTLRSKTKTWIKLKNKNKKQKQKNPFPYRWLKITQLFASMVLQNLVDERTIRSGGARSDLESGTGWAEAHPLNWPSHCENGRGPGNSEPKAPMKWTGYCELGRLHPKAAASVVCWTKLVMPKEGKTETSMFSQY